MRPLPFVWPYWPVFWSVYIWACSPEFRIVRKAQKAAVAAIVAGGLLRRHSWRLLGASFTGDVRARQNQPIVTAGACAWVRHHRHGRN